MFAASVPGVAVCVSSPFAGLYIITFALAWFLTGCITVLLAVVFSTALPVALITIEFAAWLVSPANFPIAIATVP